MKRFIVCTLALLLVTSMFAVSTNASDNSWALPNGVKDDNTIRFALLADSHIVDSDAEFKRAINAYKNFDIDLMVLNGDIVNHAKNDTAYELMKPKYDIVKNVLKDANISTVANTLDVEDGKLPLIFSMGNHEFPQTSTDPEVCATAINVYETEMGCKQNSHTVINGIHFITSGGDTYNSFIFHQEEYLTTELEKALADTPESQPVFLVIHHPIYETVRGSDSEANKKCSVEFKNFLKANPQIIVLSAHTHIPAQHPKNVWQDGFSAVGSGYIGGGAEPHSDGFLVEVNDNIVKFYKMNFISGKYVGEPWVIDVTSVDDYLSSGWSSTNRPLFPKDTKITVSNITTETAKLTWEDAIVTPTSPYQDNFVERYRVRVYDEAGNIVYHNSSGNEWFNTDYYYDNGETTTTLNVAGLKPDSKYTVKIVGESAFGIIGNDTQIQFTTPKAQYDAKVYEKVECDTRISTVLGKVDSTDKSVLDDIYASEGKSLRYNSGSLHTWIYTPKKSGVYTFELVGNGTEGQFGKFSVNDEVVFDSVVSGTGVQRLTDPRKTILCKVYMQKDKPYKLTYYAYGFYNLDYFNIYFEDVIEAESCNGVSSYVFDNLLESVVVDVSTSNSIQIPVNILSKGTYSVSLMGTNNAKASLNYNGTNTPYVQLNGDGTSLVLTQDAFILDLNEGQSTLTLSFDGDYVLDYVTLKQLPELNVNTYKNSNTSDIIINAETDYDILAGHGVGWYDTTPNSFDEYSKVENGYGWLDIHGDGTHYDRNIDHTTAIMLPQEWFKYNVDIENAGYYRLLAGIKNSSNDGQASDFKVVINGDDENTITKSVLRTNFDLIVPYDDFGLVWLNKGINSIKFMYSSEGGRAELDALRLVSPDVALYQDYTLSSQRVEAEDYVYLSNGAYTHDSGLRVVIRTGQNIDLIFNAPSEDYYDITMVAQASENETLIPYAILNVNGVDVKTKYVNNDNRLDCVTYPRETVFDNIKLKKGENIVRIISAGTKDGALCINYFDYCLSPKKVETVKAGTYDVIAKLGNWYSGETLDDKSNTIAYGKEYKPVFYMPVYDAYDNYVKTYMSNIVNDLNNITFKDVTLTGGETLYFMIWDKDNLKPLMTKRALNIALSDN